MIMFFFMIFVAETYAILCQEKGYNNCCVDYEWDEILGNCTRCKPGFYGINCKKTCQYPYFDYGCHQMCNCSKEVCDFAKGCSKDETTNEFYAKDDVKDYITTPSNIISSVAMDNMSKLTLDIEKSKDIVSMEWFNSKSLSITMICIVVLVLIALLIIFIRKMIHKRNSQRHSYQCPNDTLSEPVHYEVISNTLV